jgi:hypothetical protein
MRPVRLSQSWSEARNMGGPGHNNGPALEPGKGWHRHCWSQARKDLLPTLPIEIVRLRVRRAAEIGLDYRTYASIRATSGHDVIALLFSTNALRLLTQNAALPPDRRAVLSAITNTGRGVLAQSPLTPRDVLAQCATLIDHATPAPRPFDPWSQIRHGVLAGLKARNWPADQVLMIGDTAFEAEWAQAARMAGYLPAERFFAT